jgi:hypothetical protein
LDADRQVDETVAAIDIGANERACPVRFTPFRCAANFVDRAHYTLSG